MATAIVFPRSPVLTSNSVHGETLGGTILDDSGAPAVNWRVTVFIQNVFCLRGAGAVSGPDGTWSVGHYDQTKVFVVTAHPPAGSPLNPITFDDVNG